MKSNRPLMIVSLQERWKEYIPLAKRLARSNSPLFLAAFEDIDLLRKKASGLLIHPSGVAKEAYFKVPTLTWFKQTSVGIENTINSIKELERIGCQNVNSSSAVSLAVDKIACAKILSSICPQGNPQSANSKNAVNTLLLPGIRWTKPIAASLGKDVMRVVGHGKTALISRRAEGIPYHKIINATELKNLLDRTYNCEEFMIQDNLGDLRLGGSNFEIRIIMRRSGSGWKTSNRIARAGLLISNPNAASPGGILACSAEQALKMIVGVNYKTTLSEFEAKALEACLVIQSELDDPNELGELGVDMTMSLNGPTIIEVNSIPDLTFVDKAAECKNSIFAVMKSAGLEVDFSPTTEDDVENSRGDISDVVQRKLLNPKYRLAIEKELAQEDIWLHKDKVSMSHDGEFKTYHFNDAMKKLREEVEMASAWAKECDKDDKKLPMALDCFDNAMHRLLLLKEIYYLIAGQRHTFAMVKNAEAGSHVSDLVVPTDKIIEQVDDMEDWMTDIKKRLPKNPSEKNTPNGKYIGFEWQIINWDTPQDWDEFMQDSNYKIRKDLMR